MSTTTAHAAVAASAAPATAPARIPRPSRIRQALVMLVAVYPLITVLLYVVLPLTDGWTIWARTLLIAPIMVLVIVYFVGPQIQKHLGWFIARMPRPTR